MLKPTYQDVDLILRLYDLRRENELRRARMWFDTTKLFNAVTYEQFKKKLLSGMIKKKMQDVLIN